MNADERRWREGGAYASSRVVFGVSPNRVPARRRKIARGDACAPRTLVNGPRTAPRLMVFSLQSAFIRHLRINPRRFETF